MRMIIIGAGPCGLAAGHRLVESGITDFTIYERNPYVGGLATSFKDERGFTWDFAVHVAHSHYTYVDELMQSLLPDGFYHHIRKSWVREFDRFIPYPFQYNIRHLPGDITWECVQGMLNLPAAKAKPPVHNFEDWILNVFGQGIADHFMFPYNRKLWCVDAKHMNANWIGDRVPVVDVQRVIRNITLEQDDVSWGPNATFQFPKEGGTGAIWEKLADRIPDECIRRSIGIRAIDPKNKTVTCSDGTVDSYDYLVSTMPLTELTSILGVEELKNRSRGLQHTTVRVAGIAPNQPLPEHLSDKTWIYCPETSCGTYRVTPFSLFSPAHVPDPDQYCSLLCEYSMMPGDNVPAEDLKARAMNDLRELGLIDCHPDTTHAYIMNATYGYPIPTLERDAILGDVLPALEEMNIFSRGRFGGWKYEVSNMDHSVMQGVEAINRILHGEEEVTLPHPEIVNAGKR